MLRPYIDHGRALYAAAAAGAGPASINRLVTGSIRKLSPSRVREPNSTRSPGSPNTTSSAARFPATSTERFWSGGPAEAPLVVALDAQRFENLGRNPRQF